MDTKICTLYQIKERCILKMPLLRCLDRMLYKLPDMQGFIYYVQNDKIYSIYICKVLYQLMLKLLF